MVWPAVQAEGVGVALADAFRALLACEGAACEVAERLALAFVADGASERTLAGASHAARTDLGDACDLLAAHACTLIEQR